MKTIQFEVESRVVSKCRDGEEEPTLTSPQLYMEIENAQRFMYTTLLHVF